MSVKREIVKSGAGTLLSGLPGVGLAIEVIDAVIDPERRLALDADITEHLLTELPRMRSLLLRLVHDIDGSKCSPEEVQIIIYQTIDAQKRTLDEDKRRRLTNVLVNGLAAPDYDRAEHRLLLRATSELEEEHIDILARWNDPPRMNGGSFELPVPQAQLRRQEVRSALIRELVGRGFLSEMTQTEQKRGRGAGERAGAVELKTKTTLSSLGGRFLDHLREPEA